MSRNDIGLNLGFIKIPNSACPYCLGVVKIIESEINETVLDDNGNRLSTSNISYKCTGYCSACCRKVYVDPTRNNITYPYDKDMIDLINIMRNVLDPKNKS